MKKFLTFVLVLAMVMSVSSFAMAEGTSADVSTVEQLKEALSNSAVSTINLTADITGATEVFLISRDVIINGNDQKVSSSDARVFRLTANDITVTMNSVKVESTDVRIGTNDIRGISIDDVKGVKLYLNNCSVDFIDDSASDWSYGVNQIDNSEGNVIKINGGSYEGANVINVWGKNHNVTVKNATLTSLYAYNEQYAGSGIRIEGEGSTITVEDVTYNGNNAVPCSERTSNTNTINETNNTDNTKLPPFKVGDKQYKTLQEAVDAVGDGGTIILRDDCSGAGVFLGAGSKNFTIDFAGHTYTCVGPAVGSPGTESQAFHLEKGNTVKLCNGTITATSGSGVLMLVQNYSNLTLENMKLDGTNIGDGKYTLSNNCGNITINNTEIIAPADGVAFDVYKYASYDAPKVTVKGNSVINGKVEVAANSSANGTGTPSLEIEGGKVNGKIDKTAGDVSITGGEFSEKPNPAWVVAGKVAVGDDDGEGYVIDIKQNGTSIHVVPKSLDFGSKDYGYSAVSKKALIVTNNGSENVVVPTPAHASYNFEIASGANLLEPGESIVFNVSPKASLPVGEYNVKVTVDGGNYPSDNPNNPANETVSQEVSLSFTVKSISSGYYGPDVWYIGGNTFGTNTNQVPTSVEIDGVPVSFTMNGSQITVGCIQPGSDWVTVRWGSVSNYRSFTPDANAYCTQTVIPKTGGMSIWAAIAQFLGF